MGVRRNKNSLSWGNYSLPLNTMVWRPSTNECSYFPPSLEAPKTLSEYGFDLFFRPQNEAYTNNFKRNIEKTTFYERYRVPI